VSVRWRFDDGSTARGASVRHAFAAEGTYGAVATAEGEQGSGGASEPVRVEVGPPAKKAHGPGTGTGTKSEGPQTGPRKSRGAHQREGTPAPAATSTPGPVATGTPGPVATSTPVPAATPAPRAAAPRRPKRRRHPAPAPGGEVVRGALVSSSAPLPFPKTVAAPAAAERVAARAGDASAGGVTVAILAVLLLFGAGAWSERRKERW
jgi:PKD repeat protein